jgi:hypothetical protein
MATTVRARRSRGRAPVEYLAVIAGAVMAIAGVGLVFLPAALVLAGILTAALGLVSLGMREGGR